MPSHRLFIGSFIDTERLKKNYSKVKKELGGSIAGRWVPFENLHITYKFLGDVDGSQIQPIKQALDKFIDKTVSCDLKVAGIGAFPHVNNPRVVFLKVEEKTGILEEIYQYVQYKLSFLGFEPDGKEFVPHITVKRPKSVNGKEFLEKVEKLADTIFTELSEIEVNLIESKLSQNGATYKKI